jgi:hypothetical protein
MPLSEALFESSKHAVRSEQDAWLGVIFEKLIEERVGNGWFHFDLSFR